MANDNRIKAEEFILTYIRKLLPNGENVKIYQDMFASMSDNQFDTFMKSLDDGSAILAVIIPNFSKEQMTIERNLDVAKELGHEFFERLWMIDDQGTPPYLSTVPYLIVDLPLRRQAQLLIKKISIPEDNKSIDDFSGQPTGKSKGSKISYPETQILAAMNVENCLTELLKVRGGDYDAFNASNQQISDTGGFSLKAIEPKSGEVTSTVTLRILLSAMHLQNSL